jgi:hypothetical protein
MVPSQVGASKAVKREMSDREKQRVVFAMIATSITGALIWFSFSAEAAPKVPAPCGKVAVAASNQEVAESDDQITGADAQVQAA